MTLTQAQVGRSISVKASYTDGQSNTENVLSAATAAVANINDAPTGSVTISGSATQNQILTLNPTLSDADGLGTVSYQWLADGIAISAANDTTLRLTQSMVSKAISVQARYVDTAGASESVNSAATASVLNINDAPSGAVTIVGTATQDKILEAQHSLADADGLGTLTYQWLADGVTLNGAISNRYTLTDADVGKHVSVTARYTDAQGTVENLTSEATAAVISAEQPGIVFTGINELTTTEAGGTDSFEAALNIEPYHDVEVTLTLSNADEGQFGATDKASMTLTFTQDNWQLAQTVTLVGLDDAIHDGNMAFSMQTVVSSTDLRYDGMRSGTGFTLPNINVTNTDDDAPDVIYGDANGIVTADLLHGGNGASDVHGRDGRDEIYGGNGNDRLYGGYGDDVLFGEADNDELEGEQGNDNLNGGAGNDKLLGGSGVDTLMGGDGDDILDGLTDADSMDGGNGQDTYYVDNPGDIIKDSGSDAAKDTVYITVVLATGYTLDVGIDDATLNTDAVNGALIGNTGNNTLMGNGSNNNLNGGTGADSLSGGDGADNLLGGLGNDLLYGGNGDDAVEGGDGNDLIVGGDGAGNDRYNGGTGADTVKYSSATAAINVNLTTGKASGVDISNDTLSLIENVIGGKGNDTLVGNALANTLTGDTGNDNLDGGAGNDKMIGGAGNDTYHVRQNADVVTEVLNAGTDTVHSYLTAYVLPAQIENGRIMLTGAANLTGNSLANTLYASKGNNVLTGGEGVDAVSYQFGLAGTAGVSVNLALASAQTTGGSGSDTLIGIENLIGSDKADTLFGNVDNNVLTGAGGKDVLTGNGGNDIFDFNALSEMGSSLTTADVISDFNSGDKIDLSTLDANTATATNDAFKAVFVSSFTAAGQLKFSDGVLYGNTDADATAEFMLVLTGVNTLSASGLVL